MRRYLTEAQQAQLLGALRARMHVLARRDAAAIGLLLYTGMRIGEFASLTVAEAQFALDSGWIFRPGRVRKGGRAGRATDLRVPVTDPVRAGLRALLEIHIEMGGDGQPGAPLVLSRKGAARLSVRAYQALVNAWSVRAGIERASPHWLRHTRGMNLMRRSRAADPRGVVQQLLGHASIGSTGIYTAPTKEDLQAAAEAVDGRARLPARRVAKAYAQRGLG